MIKEHCFSKKWITGFREEKKYSKINPSILEKMINALYLLQHLVKSELVFVFKGGTSLILLLEETNRFSIDIDIITEQNKEKIETIFDKIIAESHFTNWKLNESRSYKTGIPKAHYQFEFSSVYSEQTNMVLLDILFEESNYPKVQKLPIHSKWIENDYNLLVTLPTIESIVGDKLTAFAPKTSGILYKSGKEIEIIKQLYDLGNLIDRIEDIETVAKSFQKFASKEIEYRKSDFSPNDILDDILQTAKLISLREKNKTEPEISHFKEIQKGLMGFSNFLISDSFRMDDAVIFSAKIAYLAIKLKQNDFTPFEKYTKQAISNLEIKQTDWNYLNKLKKLPNKSGFFYWYKIIEILYRI